MKKKGFEMLWSTWVIMILAFMLLLFLVLFFTQSSGNFLDNIRGYFSKSNLDPVIKGCNILSDSGNNYDFCCDKKSVKYLVDGESRKGEFSCFELIEKDFVNGEIDDKIKCGEFSC